MTSENSQRSPSPIFVKEKKIELDKSELYQSDGSNTDLNGDRFRFFVTPPDPSPIDKAWAIFETGRANWPSADNTDQQSIFKSYTNALATLSLENPTEDKDNKRQESRLRQYTNLPSSAREQYISMQITYISASYTVNIDNIEILNELRLRCKEMLKLEPNNQHLKEWEIILFNTIQSLQTTIEAPSGCGCC